MLNEGCSLKGMFLQLELASGRKKTTSQNWKPPTLTQTPDDYGKSCPIGFLPLKQLIMKQVGGYSL